MSNINSELGLTDLQIERLKLITDELILLAQEISINNFIVIGVDKDYASVTCGDLKLHKFVAIEKEFTASVVKDDVIDEGYQE